MKKTKLFINLLSILIISLFTCNAAFSSPKENSLPIIKSQKEVLKAYKSIIKEVEADNYLMYGGSFIDNSNILNIGIKNNDERTLNHFKKLFQDQQSVRFWKTDHSYKELTKKIEELNVLNEDFNKIFGNDNPIVDFGTSEKHNCIIMTLKNNTDEIRKTILNKVGNDINIQFRQGDIVLTASRSDQFRPLIGGVKVSSSSGYCTSGFGAIKSDGTKVLVVSGHAFPFGTNIYQPSNSDTYHIGYIGANPSAPRYSDSAYVSLKNGVTTKGELYLYANVVGSISSSNTPEGYTVHKHGLITGVTYGPITRKNITVNNPLGTLYKQIEADYDCSSGDSGGPVTDYSDTGEYNILGIHWGYNNTTLDSIYSPIEGVFSDLGLSRVQRYFE